MPVELNTVSMVVSTIGACHTGQILPTKQFTLQSIDDTFAVARPVLHDMREYQKFKITGVAIQTSFSPVDASTAATPILWEDAYSSDRVMLRDLPWSAKQQLATYQSGNPMANRNQRRYFPTWKALRQHGVEYASTTEYINQDWKDPTVSHYAGQLNTNENHGASYYLEVRRDAHTP